MTFNTNNSRNVANLLRHEQLDPIQPLQAKRTLPTLPANQPNSRQRAQIPLEEVFTPQESIDKRSLRRKTPIDNRSPNDPYLRGTSTQDDVQLQSFKIRLDQIIKYYDERHNNLESKIMIRLNQLENFVMKEVPKIDNNTMVSADLAGFKEALKEVRRQQEYQSHEITTLKAQNIERSNSEAIALSSKQKQKSTVLFMQLVRLGDTVQKMTDHINTMSRGYESKILDLENKLGNSQKNLMIMSQRTSSGNDVLNELGDKVMARLQTTESNLLLLGKEQVKDKEAIGRLISQGDRLGDDLQLLLRNMQTDFQSKLQNRISETISRLMYEHEERIKAHQEIKKNLDMRERVYNQKQMADKMENKARYENMDALVRNEFLRKEDSIRSLHAAMEEQFRNLMGQLQVQGNKRKEQEMIFRTEIKRVQQSFRKQYDLYKNNQTDLVQKITDIIKAEIQVRLTSELDLKKMTSDIANELVNDLNNIKEAVASSNKKLNLAIRQVANESSERAGQLSHYIDNEVKKVAEVVVEKYNKMKTVFTRLAQQLKDHILKTENNRRTFETRVIAIEDNVDKMKNEVNSEIDEFYNDLEARLKEEKEFVQTVVFKKNNDLTLRVSKLQEYTNQYFELLKAGIEDNKDLLSKKLSGINQGKNPENEEQMKELRNIVFNIKNITESIKEQNELQFREIKKDMNQLEGRSKEMNIELETSLTNKLAKNTQKTKQVEDKLNQLGVKLNSLRAEAGGSASSISNDKLKKISDDIDNINGRIKQTQKLKGEMIVLKEQMTALQQKMKKGEH